MKYVRGQGQVRGHGVTAFRGLDTLGHSHVLSPLTPELMSTPSFSQAYHDILAWVLNSKIQANTRTNTYTRVARGGVGFRVDLSDNILPTIGCRKTFPRTAAAEIAWFLLGSQSATFIRRYAPIWDKFIEEIGPGKFGVKAAYGYRWRTHFCRDQLFLALDALRKDPSDRRCYISAWDPASDGLGELGQKNVPCPVGFNLMIQDHELHSALTLRSSDVFVGLPYDVMGHALLMSAIARELNITPGVMHVTLAHAHLYEPHWEMAETALGQPSITPEMPLPHWMVSEILETPDLYVVQYGDEAKQHDWPAFNPHPHVVE